MTQRSFWIARARRLAVRRNLACWLDIFVPAATAISLLAAAALLVLRILRFSETLLWIGVTLGWFAAAAASWWLSRHSFFKVSDGLTRLDDVGKLHNRLTAALSGVGAWPAPREVRDNARWNWSRLLGPIAFSVVVLLGSAWVKVPNRNSHDHVTEPPIAWGQIESWLQTLQQSQLVEPEALQKLREEMDELRQQPAENWYNQSSLEASDTLREKTEQALKSMLDDLQKSEGAVAAASNLGQSSPPGELKALNESLQRSLHGLEMGNLPLNKELLSELKKVDITKVKELSPSQLSKMREKLKAGVRVCEKCVGPTVRPGKEMAGQSGGTGGGGKSAPLTIKQAPTNLQTKETDSVSNEDMSRAAMGDVVGLKKGEHQVKKTAPKQPVAAGSIGSTGSGGEAVWHDSLTPEEREMLQRFFK